MPSKQIALFEKCPLYDEEKPAVHGLRCISPVCAPMDDCSGSLTSGKCTVPAIVWRTIVVNEITPQRQ